MDVLFEATKEPLRLTLCVGDYTSFHCDTLVNYVLPGTREDSREDSFKVTFHTVNKGQDNNDFEKKVIANLDQEELCPWNVHKVLPESLPCSELIFIVLPAWEGNYNKVLSFRINQVLIEAMQVASRTTNIAFASFSTAPFNYPVDFFAHRMISFLTDATAFLNEDLREAHVTLFTENAECKSVFEEQLHSFGFHLERSSTKTSLSDTKPKLITLEGPDYKAFLNKFYDDVHVSVCMYLHTCVCI